MTSTRDGESVTSTKKAMNGSLTQSRRWSLMVTLISLAQLPGSTRAFVSPSRVHNYRPTGTSGGSLLVLDAVYDAEYEINQGLQRARAVLEKSKAKLAAREESAKAAVEEENPNVPFFAQTQKSTVSREGVIKSIDEKSGLVTTDGERMAAISEEEDWEFRPLFELMENELEENEDVYSLASQQLGSRDVAASVLNMRRHLHTADYLKIFDSKNFFIGDIM